MNRTLLSLAMLFIGTSLTWGTEDPNTQDKKYELTTIADCVKFAQKVGDLAQGGMNETAYDLMYDEKYFARTDFTMIERKARFAEFEAISERVEKESGSLINNGFEFVKVTKAGESLISVYFLSKHKYAPVVWRFNFYKPNDKWKFFDFGFGPQSVPEIFLISDPVDLQDRSAKNKK